MVIVYNSEWNQGLGILSNSGSKAGDTKARFSMVVSTKLKREKSEFAWHLGSRLVAAAVGAD